MKYNMKNQRVGYGAQRGALYPAMVTSHFVAASNGPKRRKESKVYMAVAK
jgi:hypothetical protein